MRGNRSMFVGLSALVLAVGMLGANGYVQWVGGTAHTEPVSRTSANRDASSDWPSIKESLGEMRDEALWDSLDHELGLNGAPARRYFPHRTEAFELAQADGQDLPPAGPPQPPRLLPDAAVPIEPTQPADWLQQLIRQELPGASEVEQRIWAQELQGFEPEAARDILRMKKNVSAAPRGWVPNWQADPEPPPSNLVSPPVEPLPASDISVANRLEPSLAALELARSIILNNLANLNTVGFKRSRVVFTAMPSRTTSETEPTFGAAPGVALGMGVELSGTPLDMSPGPFKKTNHPLDVAIEGPGFFQIQGESETLLTRSGRFAVDAEGRLCLRLGEMFCPVQPAITIPKHAGLVRISETGAVTGSEGAGLHGQLQLARFQNPCDLKQQTGQVFAVSKASGPPVLGAPQDPGFGSLRPGGLEQSNASRDEELEQFQAIQEHWHLLKHLAETADLKPLTGPLTRRPANRTERVSADLPPLPPLPIDSLKSLRDQGRDLIEEYLQSERMKTIKRTLGLK